MTSGVLVSCRRSESCRAANIPLSRMRLSIFSETALREAAGNRRLLRRASGESPLKSMPMPLGLRRPRVCGAVSKPCSQVFRQPRRGDGEGEGEEMFRNLFHVANVDGSANRGNTRVVLLVRRPHSCYRLLLCLQPCIRPPPTRPSCRARIRVHIIRNARGARSSVCPMASSWRPNGRRW